jgi:hypothetical protein
MSDPMAGIELTSINLLPEVDLFLWVLHGTNVSSNHNFYPVETKFEALTFYSRPFEPINTDFLMSVSIEGITTCSLITGSCPIIPILDKKKRKKYAFLPPLLFQVNAIDAIRPLQPIFTGNGWRDGGGTRFSSVFGLYHIKLSKLDKDKCIIKQNNHVLNFDQLLLRFGDSVSQSYSTLFKIVYDYCATIGLNPETCILGLYSCQSFASQYEEDYNRADIRGLIPKHIDNELVPAPIFNHMPVTEGTEFKPYILSLPIVKPIDTNWSALAKMKYQGCALNVLSYYGILQQARAREEVTCLTIKGTSIFRVMDYIYNFFSQEPYKSSYPWLTENSYIIVRYPVSVGFQQMFNYITSQGKFLVNQFFIFKLYRDLNYGEKLSQIGHTVSIAVYEQNIYYIDPQSGIGIQIEQSFDINSLYPGTEFKYVDILFIWALSSQVSFPAIIYAAAEIINVRNPDITYGGKRKTKKNGLGKNKTKKNKSKSYKVKVKRTKTKTKLDPFEKIMRETDRANHVRSILIIDDKV